MRDYTCTEANNTARDGQHPKHAVDGNAVRSGGHDATKHNEKCSENNGRLSAEIIAGETHDNLAKYLTDKQGIRYARADG